MGLCFLAGCATPSTPAARTVQPSPATLAVGEPTATALAPLSSPGFSHTVSKGETLWRIAQRYGVELRAVVESNHLRDTRQLHPGQRLWIPSEAIASSRTPRRLSAEEFIWPVRGEVVSAFGAKTSWGLNKGMDIRLTRSTSVLAAKSGRVVFSGTLSGLEGKTLVLEHPDGFVTVYSRLEELLVQPGVAVKQGAEIARAGSGRGAEPSMLHFEIRLGHRPENPIFFLP